ncbi:F-box protein [Raphanus sativus]|uniref:F-box protein At4g11590-like n=1 Tax=Raphanus sativus TaxID=3726 RepID=A0A6J0MBY9_RAPSA|nr:F-box protein At4g11590-like [Raphanus sativus]KAJ4912108.1 F-box protein [Raphanus sativus]
MKIRCSKKKKLKNQIPQHLVMEILARLPAKSVARFLLVSKSWANLITGRDFIRSFETRSRSSQPRLLVCFIGRTKPSERQYCYFYSSYSSSTTFLSRVKCPRDDPEGFSCLPHYANGFIRIGYGEKKLVCNPSTGKSITLPRVKSVNTVSKSLFGYDPVNEEYKILCMTKILRNGDKPHSRYEYQVLTLGGADEKSSWRMIECSIPHLFCCNAYVCIDGVVYFVAKTFGDLCLMKFDLRYEKWDLLTRLSSDMSSVGADCTLINYEGKVAITTNTSGDTFNVWVIDQTAREPGWLKKSFTIKSWKFLSKLSISGSTHTGEFVLAPRYYSHDFNVALYNPNTNALRKIKVDVTGGNEFKHGRRTKAMVFWDYAESIRLL